jgi:hypothetical protein
MKHPRRNSAAAGFSGGSIPLGKRHAQKPIDKLLETHARVSRMTFVKPCRNIGFDC